MRYFLGFLLALSFASPAAAAWREAQTEHFVIYADDSEKDLIRFSEYLERYHAALAYLTRSEVQTPSPSNRVTIYVVGAEHKLKSLYGDRNSTVAGFYVPRAGGTVAFVPKLGGRGNADNWSLVVLLHEYAHHFLISSSRVAMPLWLSEGAAEFYASASFSRDGSVELGRPANHRGWELFQAEEVPIRDLLDESLYSRNKGRRYDAFYGRSWLLYHFLIFSSERHGQIQDYWQRIANGAEHLQAAEQAFGDLDELDDELDAYLLSKRMRYFNITPELLGTGEVSVTVRELSEGHGDMMPVIMQSHRGVTHEEALELLGEAREISAKYPRDPNVLTALAEAELDAGYTDAAIIAADRAIAIDAGQKNAYVQKGKALFSLAADAADRDAAYKAAMVPFSQLNKLENDHPLPLIYYYRSFAERGEEPPDLARNALEQAANMAPFDKSLWFNYVMMLAEEGKIAAARALVKSLLVDPHGGSLAQVAGHFAAQLESAPEGEPFAADMSGLMKSADESEGDGADASE